jgi:hypothetical protein
MGSLTLHLVDKVEVLPSHPVSGFPDVFATTIVVTGTDGRFEISLFSAAPIDINVGMEKPVTCCRCLREIIPGEPMGTTVSGHTVCAECGAA